MRRISTGLTLFALAAAVSCAFLPRSGVLTTTEVAEHKPNFSSAGVDPMPVGTAKQMARIKRVRSAPSRKA